jgi:cysteine desulfurase
MTFFKKKRIYLDYASTTPVLREVKKEMDKYWTEAFHNPSSIYEEGVDRKRELDAYRTKVARILGVQAKEVIFTSGGTESDNTAILGAFEVAREKFAKPHLIISSIEHPAVSEAAKEVIRRGGEVSVAGVDEEGFIQPVNVLKLLRKETFMVSIMLANNEIGTIEPVSKVARLLREERKKNNSLYPYIHTDASQAPNTYKVNAEQLHVDLLTLDGSKIYGPKGA